MRIFISFTFLTTILLLSISCQSAKPEFSEDMTVDNYFQKAQEASERGDHQLAMEYYLKLKEVFPENIEKNLWASFEIAFLYHKMGKDEKALVLLEELIQLYNDNQTQDYPDGPLLLAERVKANIQEKDSN